MIRAALLSLALFLGACRAAEPELTPTFHAEGKPELLSEWGQIGIISGELNTADRVQHYTLAVPLFSDYAHKFRTVWMPEGASAVYDEIDVFDFPIGTVITKTFYYPVSDGPDKMSGHVLKSELRREIVGEGVDLSDHRLIETRILARREEGWIALPYIWNEDQTEARLKRVGAMIPLTLNDGDTQTEFKYQVPNTNQCAGCHATDNSTGEIQPIGPKARHLRTLTTLQEDGGDELPQLEIWQVKKLVGEAKALFEPVHGNNKAETEHFLLNKDARAYLDINCSHCHSRTGPADTSGLFLEPDDPAGPNLGICKTPIAAGTGTGNRHFGIVPGDPDQSVFIFRMDSRDPAVMMPELGRSLIHEEGVELIRNWISQMEGGCN